MSSEAADHILELAPVPSVIIVVDGIITMDGGIVVFTLPIGVIAISLVFFLLYAQGWEIRSLAQWVRSPVCAVGHLE